MSKKPIVANKLKSKPPGKKKVDGKLPLTGRQKKFITEYLKDLNATQAAIRAGYSKKTAGQMGDENLRKPQIATAIAAAREKLEKKSEITQEMVLKRFWDIATADPNELIEYRWVACGECWPGGKKIMREPNPDCQACEGHGHGIPIPKDTTKLSRQAKALYAGVKVTKDGLQVLMHDQLTALTKVGQHLGLFPTKVEMTGKNGGPMEFENITDSELDRRIKALEAAQK